MKFTLLAIFFLPVLAMASDWETWDNEDGISVEFRPVAGKNNLQEFRGTAIIAADLTTISSVIRDTESLPNWIYNLKKARMEKINDQERFTHFFHDAPWFVGNKDSIALSRVTQDKQSLQVVFRAHSVPDKYPKEEGYGRILEGESSWTLNPLGVKETEVVFQGWANPGGLISFTVVQRLGKSHLAALPFESLRNLKERVKLKKHMEERFSFIENYKGKLSEE